MRAVKTILVFDLKGYSDVALELEEQLSADAVRLLHEQIRDFAEQALKTVGLSRELSEIDNAADGVFLAFDSPSIAHQCACAFHEICRTHNAGISTAAAKRWFRIGMATGEVVPDPTGGPKKKAGTAIARAVRLEGKCGVGEILVDIKTYEGFSDSLKQCYGAVEEIPGKRKEMFAARRCVVVPGIASLNTPTVKNPAALGKVASTVPANAVLAVLRDQVKSGVQWALTSENLSLILSHTPQSLDEYRLARIAEWSQPRYAIDKQFTPLTLLVDQGEEAQGDRWQAQARPQPYTDLREVLSEVEEPALVVLGPPGCGKSTLLRHLELEWSLDVLRQPDQGAPVSLFLPLSSYGKKGDALPSPLEWIAQEWQKRNASLESFKTLLGKGRLLLLLDAVNEIPHASEADYANRIQLWRDFLSELIRTSPGTRVVFTCRELDYSASLSTPELRVPHVRIERLNDGQVEKFLSQYSPVHGPRLWQQLKSTPRQLDLFRSPFYLRMLLAQAARGSELLNGRAALFTGFVREALVREQQKHTPILQPGVLLDQRDHAKLTRGEWRDVHELPVRGALFPSLAKFAFDLQQRHGGSELAQVRVDYDQAMSMMGAHAELILSGGVALQVLEQQFDDVYFVHQLVQEFFAARHLCTLTVETAALARSAWRIGELLPTVETLLKDLAPADPLPAAPATGWEETFLLAAAMRHEPEIWLRALMADNLPLAGRCAAQPDVRVSDILRNELRQALVLRSRDPAADLRARIVAGHTLGELGDPRFERRAGPHGAYLLPPMIAIATSKCTNGSVEYIDVIEATVLTENQTTILLSQFPVTNAEYRCFIKAGGYVDARWWLKDGARRWWLGEGTGEGAQRNWRNLNRPEFRGGCLV